MPKYNEPHNPVGLTLRALIEGELMVMDACGLDYADIKDIADSIEKRIQDGPSDWLSLSDGTTFTKTWVPACSDETAKGDPSQVKRAVNTIHAAHEQRVKANIEKARLEEDITNFETFLASFGSRRVYV